MVHVESITFILSLIILAAASQQVIKATVKLSQLTGIAEAAIGFILISTMTSMPELLVSTLASYEGAAGIAIGNVLGSNIANILVVLGMAMMLGGLAVKRKEISDIAEVLVVVTFLPLIFFIKGDLAAQEGLVLLAVFVLYALFILKGKYTFKLAESIRAREWVVTNVIFWLGLVIVIVSADFVVKSGTGIAEVVGVPASVIGLTVIALGTSLPELAIAVAAIRSNKTEIAFSEVIGSNIVNLTLVLGAASLAAPLHVRPDVFGPTIIFLVGVSMLLLYLLIKHGKLSKTWGVGFIMLYLAYALLLAFGGKLLP
jgi:cation:H+ antiporter